jgi:PAS domain S-box-containing protein
MMTENKYIEESINVPYKFLKIANRYTEMKPLLDEFVFEIKKLTRCDSVGIRMLDKEGNIPYEAYQGFSREFYKSESPLSIRTDNCMCINVIKGDVDPSLSFYTDRGSFFMNGTTKFLATVSEEEKGKTRNVCNLSGYESVALIPISLGDNIFGMIHLADHNENMVPLKIVESLEIVAMQLATAIQRVWIQQDLKESENRFRRLFNGVSDAIIIINENKRIIDVNETTCRLLGYAKEEILNLSINDIFLMEELDDIEDVINNLLESNLDYKGENILIGKKGNPIIIDAGYTTIKIENQNFVIGSFTDITERTKTEELTKLLIRIFSHDLRSPFTVIRGFLELALLKNESPEIENYLTEAMNGTLGALSIVYNGIALLKLSKQHYYDFFPTNILHTLNTVEEIINSQFPEQNLCIDLKNIENDSIIYADSLLERLFWNLISNSIKNKSSNDNVEIEISLDVINGKTILMYSDNSKGIPVQIREKLIQDEFSTFKKKGDGSGLGLWIINQLAKRYKWNFSIKNRVPGDYTKGTTFIFEMNST